MSFKAQNIDKRCGISPLSAETNKMKKKAKCVYKI